MKTLAVILILFFSTLATWAQNRLVPDFAVVQYAGSIGFFSAGAGYNIMKNKGFASVQYGNVPESRGGELNIVAGKLMFNTFTLKVSDKVKINPLAAGLMASYHFGSAFSSSWPSHRYPDGYYWWKTSLRFHLNTQTSITHEINTKSIKSLTYYIDLNANDLYLASFFQNHKSLKLSEVIKIGYGIRATF
jgi:hypothetical protein